VAMARYQPPGGRGPQPRGMPPARRQLPPPDPAVRQRALAALKQFAAYGTTTIEAKSGYGLDVASELKILGLHKELNAEQPLEIVSTFLGAHALPPSG